MLALRPSPWQVRESFETGCSGSSTLGSILDAITGMLGQDVRVQHKAEVVGLVKEEHQRRRLAA